MLPAARVLKAESATQARREPDAASSQAYILRREVHQAQQEAAQIVETARARAEALLAAATQEARARQLTAVLEGRAQAAAEFSAHAMALAAREARTRAQQLEQSVDLARLLAERLLGAELQLQPERVLDLAHQVLRELQAAGSVQISAHPEDAVLLAQLQRQPDLVHSITIVSDDSLPRGELSVVTEFGRVDAPLAVQLSRLAEKLRESLVQTR